jgi:oligopeptidase B
MTPAKPPVAHLEPETIELHGKRWTDPYAWLRDKANPATIPYLEAENRYMAEVMAPEKELEETLYREIVARVREADVSAPVPWGGFEYFTRTEEGKQYAIHCRREGAEERVLLDGNELAAGHEYFQLGAFAPSNDHRLLAYSIDTAGDERFTLYVKNVATGEIVDHVDGAYYGAEWAADNRELLYLTLDEAHRPYKAFRHRLGAAQNTDSLLYHEPDERFELALGHTRSLAYVYLSIHSHTTSEVRYVRADHPEDLRVLIPRQHDIEYDFDHHGDFFYIRTSDGTRNFRVARAPVADPSREQWTEVLPHRDGIMVEDLDCFREHLVVTERDNGLAQIRIQRFSTGEVHRVAFDEPAYSASTSQNPEFDTATLRFTYSSLVTPSSVFDYDMNARTRVLRKQQEVLGGYDPSQYVSERIFALAKDGARIPISLICRKGVLRDGTAPALLYGYGSYGLPMDAAFDSTRLSLLDRGFIYAIAHIRGGGDLGKPWHDAAKMLTKPTTFSDFIGCAEHLIAQGYTRASRLAIHGRSAGGLLIGAALNLRPDLFAAAIAGVPFVDVLNTMLDDTLPLTIGEYEEWGNPEDEAYFNAIRSYAPYENVAPLTYPNLLVTAGINDPRVSFWEPAKWVARLRAVKTGDNLLLLKTNLGAGHFGPSGRYSRWRETAFEYAFLLKVLSPPK